MFHFLLCLTFLGSQALADAWTVEQPAQLVAAIPATVWLPVPTPPDAHFSGGELVLDLENPEVQAVPFRDTQALQVRLRVFQGAGRPIAGAVPVVQSNMTLQPYRNGEPSWWSSASEALFTLEPASLPVHELDALRRDGFWVVYDVFPEGQAHDPLLFRAWAYPGDGPVWCGEQP